MDGQWRLTEQFWNKCFDIICDLCWHTLLGSKMGTYRLKDEQTRYGEYMSCSMQLKSFPAIVISQKNL